MEDVPEYPLWREPLTADDGEEYVEEARAREYKDEDEYVYEYPKVRDYYKDLGEYLKMEIDGADINHELRDGFLNFFREECWLGSRVEVGFDRRRKLAAKLGIEFPNLKFEDIKDLCDVFFRQLHDAYWYGRHGFDVDNDSVPRIIRRFLKKVRRVDRRLQIVDLKPARKTL